MEGRHIAMQPSEEEGGGSSNNNNGGGTETNNYEQLLHQETGAVEEADEEEGTASSIVKDSPDFVTEREQDKEGGFQEADLEEKHAGRQYTQLGPTRNDLEEEEEEEGEATMSNIDLVQDGEGSTVSGKQGSEQHHSIVGDGSDLETQFSPEQNLDVNMKAQRDHHPPEAAANAREATTKMSSQRQETEKELGGGLGSYEKPDEESAATSVSLGSGNFTMLAQFLNSSIDDEVYAGQSHGRSSSSAWQPSSSSAAIGIEEEEEEVNEDTGHFEEVPLKEPGEYFQTRSNLKSFSSADALAMMMSEQVASSSSSSSLHDAAAHAETTMYTSSVSQEDHHLSRIVAGTNGFGDDGKQLHDHHQQVSATGLISFRSLNFSPPPGKEVLPPRLISAHSYDGSGVFPEPRGSPLLQKGKEVLPAVFPPKLVELIEAAIQGVTDDRVHLRRLRRVVCGEEGEEDLVLGEEENHDGGGGVGRPSIASCVVDILIAKMGGVDGLDDAEEESAPRMMLSAGAAVVAGELLTSLPCRGDDGISMSPRTRMTKALALVLQACTRNRVMCAAAGLLRVLLFAAPSLLNGKPKREGELEVEELWDSGPFLDAIEALGSHRVTVLDLREWLAAAAKTSATGKSMDLILTLERAMSGEETRGPSHTFEFDGESSGLLGPGESKWPFVTGYAFATWLYIESFADTVNTAAAAAAIAAAAAAKSGKSSAMSAAAAASALAGEGTAHMPRLFSFLSVDNLGVEAYFHGQFLVVESVNGKGRKASLHFTHPFQPRRWYFIGLEHTHRQSILGKLESEMKLYIDGRLYESRPLVFPRLSRPLSFCCIGTNPPPAIAGLQRRRRQCPLFAEMGPIYIFKEPLGPERMAHLAARGGDALPAFGAGAGTPWFANNEQAMSAAEDSAALDLELGPRLHLLYHPKLLNGHSCPDASPAGAAGM
jgi:hypothetical protein